MKKFKKIIRFVARLLDRSEHLVLTLDYLINAHCSAFIYFPKNPALCGLIPYRGVINGKTGKHLPYTNFETTAIL